MDKRWIRYFLISWILLGLFLGSARARRKPKERGIEKVACEGQRMNLSCHAGTKLHIIRASYGRFVLSLCNDQDVMTGWNLMCMSVRSFQIVVNRCHNQNNCVMYVDNRLFGDPCPGTVKYLKVTYICRKPEPTPPPTTTPLPTTTRPSTARPVLTTEIVVNPGVKELYCPARRERGIQWPKTLSGQTAVVTCPGDSQGNASWRCGRPGKSERGSGGGIGRWLGSPDLSLCTSKAVRGLKQMANNGTKSGDVVEKVAQVTRDSQLVGGDLIATSEILKETVKSFQAELSSPQIGQIDKIIRAKKFSKAMIESSSNILDKKQEVSWEDLGSEKRKTEVATSLLQSLEQSAEEVAEVLDNGQSVLSKSKNIMVEINVIETSSPAQVKDQVFPKPRAAQSQEKLTDNQITVPSKSLTSVAQKGRVKVIFAVYDNLGQYMSPSNEESDASQSVDGTRPEQDPQDSAKKTIVNSNIISASFVGARHPVAIPEPLQYIMKHNKTKNVTNPRCAFWDYDSKARQGGSGRWSTLGCRLVKTNSTHTQCECDHMTNFAVLMDVVGVDLHVSHVITLQVITYAGCLVSIVCLFICFLTFVCFRNLQSDRNTIHKNLVLCLLVAEVLFLTGIAQVNAPIMCSVVAGLLHFLFLCAFSWMCLEGIQLYMMLIEVFEAERSRVKWYYLAGYGVPIIIVAVSAAVFPGGYGTKTHCWLSTERGFIWAFVGPVMLVITINVIMLSIAIYVMCKHAKMSAGLREKSRLNSIRAWVKSALVLVVLLGLTWAFGVLYVNSDTVVMAYIFTVLNALQGAFIFIFHCLMNDKVQKEWKKCVRRTSWLPECVRVGYGGERPQASSTPSRSNSSAQNYFTRLLSGRRRKRSSTTSLPKSVVLKNNNVNYDSYHDSGHGSSVFHESDGSGKCVDLANAMNDRLQGQSPSVTTGYNRTPVSLYLPAYSKTEMLKQKQNGEYNGLIKKIPDYQLDQSVDDMSYSEYSDADLFKLTDYSEEPRRPHVQPQVSRIEEVDEGYGYEIPIPERPADPPYDLPDHEPHYDLPDRPAYVRPAPAGSAHYHVLEPIRDSGMVPDSPEHSPENSPSLLVPEKSDAATSMGDLSNHNQLSCSVQSNSDNNDPSVDNFPTPDKLSQPDISKLEKIENVDKDALRSMPNLSYTNHAFEDSPFKRQSLHRRSGSDPGNKYKLGESDC